VAKKAFARRVGKVGKNLVQHQRGAIMLNSSLHRSDDLGEHGESDHNAAVAYFLGRAYSCLREARYLNTAYSEAAELARACLS